MKKDLIFVGVIVIVLALLLSGVKFQSVEDYYSTHLDEITPESETVFLSIRCDTILNNYDKLDEELKRENNAPTSGEILSGGEYVLRDGDTVLSILKRITRYYKIPLIVKGEYVESINGLSQFDYGTTSGWLFKLNGVAPSVSCNIKINDGDKIEWLYSCELGEDL